MVIMQKNDSKFHPNFPVIPKYIYFFKPLPGFMVKVAKVVLEFQQHFYWVKAFTIGDHWVELHIGRKVLTPPPPPPPPFNR